ncbi:MAG: hypothetical protein IKK45_03625 [Akkermansia sp.]|nr:hypothetical protein [Akkermansia sp.]
MPVLVLAAGGKMVYTFCGMVKNRYMTLLLALLRLGLGGFFLLTGMQKVAGLGETADFLTRSRLLPEVCSMPLACIGVSMELVVAACLLGKWHYRGATVWALAMCGTFLFLYLQAWVRGLELSCNCLGSTHEIVDYPLDTGMRLLLLGAVLLLFWEAHRPTPGFGKIRKYDFTDC